MNRLKQATTSHRRTALSAALYGAGIFGALAAVTNAHAIPITGLEFTGFNLVTFDSAAPNTFTSNVPISGLAAGDFIVGIDFRPLNSMLYGFSQTGRIYVITAAGQATEARPPVNLPITSTAFFGFDFNPAIDRIRLTSDEDTVGQSNRVINLGDATATGVRTDTDLIYAPAPDPNAGANPNVEASAYTNNFGPTPPTTTTLFGIDTDLDILVRQGGVDGNPSPNLGVLSTVGSLGAGINFGPLSSFDIAGANQAFASSGDQSPGSTNPSTLYTIDLGTGAATLVGGSTATARIGPAAGAPGALRVIAIAVPIQAAPATPGAIQFNPTTLTVAENVGNAVLTVTRPAGSTGAVTVIATPTNGTGAAGAVAPGDFTATPITVSFAAADLSRPVNVPIIDDTAQEGAETFTVVLSAPTGGATVGANGTATVTISANDTAAPPPPAPAPTDDDDGGCTVNPNGRDAGLLLLLLGGALAALRRRMKR